MKKGITPVISLIMLMLITVGMVGVAYAWFSNLLTTQTEKGISIPPGGAFCSNGLISVLVQNNGATSDITTDADIIIRQVNGGEVSGAAKVSTTISPGSGKIVINQWNCGGSACPPGANNIRIGTRTGVVESSAYCK